MSDDEKTALPVADLGEDFDLDLPPATGQEYLRRVIQEAKDCPRVVVADINTKSYLHKQTLNLTHGSGALEAPSGYAPSVELQKHQTAQFSHVRQSFIRWKARMKAKKVKKPEKLPGRSDVDGWCKLSFGRLKPTSQNTSGNDVEPTSQKTPSNDIEEGSATEAPPSNARSPPLLSILAFMDQPTVIDVLEYHVNWFEATGFSKEQGEWLYALLVCLEKPLEPESCSLLRNLARICSSLRATLDTQDHPFLPQLNLFICIVAHYFDQKDLADTS